MKSGADPQLTITTTLGPRSAARRLRLADAAGLERTVRRLAHEVLERHPALEGVVLAAIREGGVPVARRLRLELATRAGAPPPVAALDLRPYRDDRPRARTAAVPAAGRALPALDGGPRVGVDGTVVILVDDVLHTGRSLRAALDLLAAHGRPAAVEPLVLFDRGHRELPLRATYVGRNVPVAAGEWIEVDMDGTGAAEAGAWLVQRSPGVRGGRDTSTAPVPAERP